MGEDEGGDSQCLPLFIILLKISLTFHNTIRSPSSQILIGKLGQTRVYLPQTGTTTRQMKMFVILLVATRWQTHP